jgi:hypothetical protein
VRNGVSGGFHLSQHKNLPLKTPSEPIAR